MLRRLLVLVLLATTATALHGWQDGAPLDSAAARFSPSPRQELPLTVRFSGVLVNPDGSPRVGAVSLTFSFYGSRTGGDALWVETQTVIADNQGKYSVLLGSASRGLPLDIFSRGEAKWLGVRNSEEPGAQEQERVQLVSVPYALASANSLFLAGRPATDYQLTKAAAAASQDAAVAAPETFGQVSSSGNTPGRIAKFTATDAIGDSVLFENSGNVGIGTTTPSATLSLGPAVGEKFDFYQSPDNSIRLGIGIDMVNGPRELNLFTTSPTLNGSGRITLGYRREDNGQFVGNVSILNSGNVGIGTSTPAATLSLGPTVGEKFDFYQSSDSSVRLGIGIDQVVPGRELNLFTTSPTLSGTGRITLGYRREDNGQFVGNVTVLNSGNVGIGTSTPAATLSLGPTVGEKFDFYQSPDNTIRLGIGIDQVNGPRELNLFTTSPTLNGSGRITLGYRREDNGQFVGNVAILNSGNVGIGTSFPSARLDVVDSNSAQAARFTQNGAGSGSFSVGTPPPAAIRGDASSATGVTAGVLGITSATLGRGVLGESLSTTGQNMGVYGVAVNSPDGTGVWGESTSSTGDAAGVFGRSASVTGTGVFGEATAATGDAAGVAGVSRAAGGTGVQGEVTATSGQNYGISGRVFNNTTAGSTAGMFINTNTNAASGSLLLGRTSTDPNANNVFRIDTAGKGFFNGGTATTGADFAESVAVREDRSEYEPGDVIAIDTTGVRRFGKVAKPYSTLVAGIYSTKPGVLATPHHPEDPRIVEEEIPLAVVGIVPCKVTNENGEIHAGDLLVASSRAGYAMKGTDRKRMNGAVIGKALQSLKGTTGVIEVLVSLQ